MMGTRASAPDHTGHHRGRHDGKPMRARGCQWPLVKHRYTARAEVAEENLTVRAVAEGLGMSPTTVQYWVLMGWLNATWVAISAASGRGNAAGRYAIEEQEVLDFIEDPRSTPFLKIERIADPTWREWAQDSREGTPWHTSREVGRRAGFVYEYVCYLAKRGLVRKLAFRNANRAVYHLGDALAVAGRRKWPLERSA